MIRQIHSYSPMSDMSTIFYPSLKTGRLVRPGGCRPIDRPGGPIRVSRSRLEFKVSWLARTPGIWPCDSSRTKTNGPL